MSDTQPYFTPSQSPPAGTPLSTTTTTGSPLPTLFTPLTLRSLTLPNRFAVAPMCMYSSPQTGHLTDFHLTHYSAFALRGAPLTILEATAVLPNGRISPYDSGLWEDTQIAPLKRIVEFIHSQGQKVGVQLAHAGRKASILPGWDARWQRGVNEVAAVEDGGWPEEVWGPSEVPYSEVYVRPRPMTKAQIKEVVEGFREAARRAVEAGVDTVEVHGAHGYLISEFLSPVSNKRTDEYGGSFENRIRLLTEVVTAVREVIPETMPLLVRVSATEWMEHTGLPFWDVGQTIQLARLLPDLGVDLLDVSSGGNHPDQQIKMHSHYQIDIAAKVREALRAEGKSLLIGAVGMVTTADLAREVVQEEGVEVQLGVGLKAKADLVLVGRQFLREPEFVLRTAHELGVKVKWPVQYARAPFS
ncbi:hypothetical protein B0T16DRAFT_425632 [Cercophora newfieldiana]|uniref:NADH:flavin oxidoreductase/NADH oxidase N-terminal domain-containing protein n=1 Tax=Cercophora newfieldiana TaxID=92897 RepID=A0AA40CZJ2_9PEZI|nr:hypothetical protein B0T16DRAFT_425632 [Cercophora newfieldiana]